MKHAAKILAFMGCSVLWVTNGIADELESNLVTDKESEDVIMLDEESLSSASGRGDLQEQKSDTNQSATLGDNKLTSGSTGQNVISSSAFSNLEGISHVIQNSGNNVIIQDSTTFNVQFLPGSVN